jgi:hypothetical protein
VEWVLTRTSDYRLHADKCRELARNALNEEHRAQLLKMAEGLERLAAEREGLARSTKPHEHKRVRRLLSLFNRSGEERGDP